MTPRAFLFDAYGTLFDVHSVVAEGAGELQGDLTALSVVWRQKQLEFTWLRSLMGRYEDFWEVTRASLYAAVRHVKIEATDSQLDRLMQAYLRPAAFPDTRLILDATNGAPRAILSNGSPAMLESAVRHNRMEADFADLISVDRVQIYKPSPRAYALGTQSLRMPAGDILFVSSNSWDAAGAKAFGYSVCWCNRAGAELEHLGFAPDLVVSRLDEIVGVV